MLDCCTFLTLLLNPFNLDSSSNALLWLHTIFAFLYLLLTVYSMRRHTSKMHYKEDDLVGGMLWENPPFGHIGLSVVGNYFLFFISMQVKRTLFVNGLSKYAEESEIKQHFE